MTYHDCSASSYRCPACYRGYTMETKAKLISLELISGIFGWLWVVATLSALYFLAMVVFSNGTWTNFFGALGAGIVGKWLSKGFKNNQQRVAFEAKLIEEGRTPEEAAKEWSERYMGG